MRKTDSPLSGTLLCARFTFTQAWKTRANLISFVILLVWSMVMPSLSSMTATPYEDPVCGIETVYLQDESGIGFPDLSVLSQQDNYYSNLSFCTSSADLSQNDVRMVLRTENSVPTLLLERSVDSSVSDSELYWLYQDSLPLLREHFLKGLGLSEQEASFLAAGSSAEWCTSDEFLQLQNGGIANLDHSIFEDGDQTEDEPPMSLQLGYSIALMMVSMMAASFIIREVITEKSSKLVDLLMVSLRAPAMLLGKILGVLGYVITMLLGVFAGFLISDTVTGRITGSSAIAALLQDSGSALGNVGISTWIVLFVTLVLSLLLFALLAALMGAGCSTEEDTSSALGIPMLLIMGGYMVSIVGAAFTGTAVVKYFCLIPVLSGFTVPVQYLTGTIGLGTAALSWLIQLALIAGLIWLCGTLYSSLLVYKGSRLDLGKIIKMALANRKEEA